MDANLARAKAAVDRFERSVSAADGFDENLAQEYNRLRRALAASFQAMSMAAVPRAQYRLDDVKRAVEGEMRRLYEGRIDSKFFPIRRYSTPHPDIYALLAARVGESVPGWRIRLLSGDKIHTERRTRELRDLGLSIEVTGDDDESMYRLTSLEPNLRYAAAFQLRENASRAGAANFRLRADVIRTAELTIELPARRRS